MRFQLSWEAFGYSDTKLAPITVDGLEADLGLVGNQYSICLVVCASLIAFEDRLSSPRTSQILCWLCGDRDPLEYRPKKAQAESLECAGPSFKKRLVG